MKVVIQRVKMARVEVNGVTKGEIRHGLLIYLGIAKKEEPSHLAWMVNKIANTRIFNDDSGVMNLSVRDINGACLVISQFTLLASTKKGHRPSYSEAAKPEIAKPIYKEFVEALKIGTGLKVETGEFGANMRVTSINDGPVTILVDSMNRV